MNRNLHNAMLAQYATPKVSGDGLVSWENGVKCVMPSVRMLGAVTQETLAGSNLFDGNFKGGYITGNADGTRVIKSFRETPTQWYLIVMPCEPDTVYYVSKSGGAISLAAGYTTEYPYTDIVIQGLYERIDANACKVTTGADAAYLVAYCFNTARGDDPTTLKAWITKDAPAAYEPYCGGIPAPNPSYPIMPVCNDGAYRSTSPDGSWDGGTAKAPELWAIPGTDIRDEWDSQTGWGVRRVRKLVLDGTEHWENPTYIIDGYSTFRIILFDGKPITMALCSHFPVSVISYMLEPYDNRLTIYPSGRLFQLIFRVENSIANSNGQTDVSEWKAYLAAQYVAGTPVTVWYALAKPEPFYFAPARLTQPNGPGQIIQVSGSVPECPIEANYLTHS